MRIEIHRSISEVDRGKWDAIVPKNQIFSSHGYIELLEKSGLNKDNCYYPVVYDRDTIVAHTCAYYVREEIDLFAQGAVKNLIDQARRRWKNFFILRTLEAGPPVALGNILSFKDGIDRSQALRVLCQGVEGLAKQLGIKFVLFRDFYNDESELCASLSGLGYMKMHNLPKAEIDIRWKSFDEYLNSMRSNYRCKIVKSMDKCAKGGISIRPLKDFSGNSRELKRLHDNVSNQAKEIKREPVSEAFFRDISKYLGEKAALLVAVKDGKFIGFMLTLFNDKELVSALIGLDYDYNREYYVYFNLFYETIKLAIESGMDKIDMGVTALNPKRDMGSRILSLNMYMKHSNALLNKIIPVLFDMITPPDTTESRNVFK